MEIPNDSDGRPLAWPMSNQTYIDAWNGIYFSLDELMSEIPYWTASESDRVLAFGEGAITENQVYERRGGK